LSAVINNFQEELPLYGAREKNLLLDEKTKKKNRILD
jgi:hypothetical protein